MLNIRSANRRIAFIKSRGMCGENHPLVVRAEDGTCPVCVQKAGNTSASYRDAADEAMSYCLETTKDKHAKYLLLTALNIGAHEHAAQQGVQPTVLAARHKLVSCPQCLLVFGVDLPAPHIG